jgi:polyisoprenoid-binding protein YceI
MKSNKMNKFLKYGVLLIMASIFFLGRAKAQVYKTNNGEISFVSKTDFKEFKAVNNNVSAAASFFGKVQFRVPINSFIFKSALMQEHFQENYMESSTYPNASFKGSIIEPEKFKLTSQNQEVKVKGVLNIHGVDHEEMVDGTIQETKDGVVLKANFSIQLDDYNIKIPKNNLNDISETINIKIDCLLLNKPKKK